MFIEKLWLWIVLRDPDGRESRTPFSFRNSCLRILDVSDKYTRDNAADLNQLSMDLKRSEDNKSH